MQFIINLTATAASGINSCAIFARVTISRSSNNDAIKLPFTIYLYIEDIFSVNNGLKLRDANFVKGCIFIMKCG